MAISANATCREVLSQIVHDPDYRKIAALPMVSWEQVAVVAFAYGAFAASSIAYLYGILPWPLMLLINAIAIYASFTPLHDATHRSASRNLFINDAIGTISGQLLFPGVTTKAYRALHLTHHRFTGDKHKDPDELLASAPNWALPFLLPFTDWYWAYWYVTQGRDMLPKSFAWTFGAFMVINVGVTVGLLLSPYWFEALMIWLIPQRLGLFMLVYLFAHVQHPDDAPFEEKPFQSTVYIPANWMERFFMLGQTDHCIHHLLPNVPYYRYKDIWDLGNRTLDHQDIPAGSMLVKLRRAPEPAPKPLTLEAVVTEARPVAKDVRAFTLEPRPGAVFPRFEAGAHVALHLPSGAIRHYSLCGDPAESGSYRIAVKREAEGRGGSREAHEALSVGDAVVIGAPKNNFMLYEKGARFTLIAGGIGATPLLAMAHRLARLGKPFELHLCARDAESLPFGAELSALPFADAIHKHLDREDGRSALDPDLVIGPYAEGARLYLCGPAGFMGWLRREATRLGWPENAVLSESFAAPMQGTGGNLPFEVTLAKSGQTFTVPGDRAIIDMLPDLGVNVKTSCMQGVCGTCVTRVIEGEVEHRDSTLTEAERASNQLMCVCISRAKKGGKLVLDL